MRTNATIAITDGKSCKAVYLHWDGYVAWAGAVLYDDYNTREKAEALIALGSISSLSERIAPEPGEEHSFDNPAENVTVAYCRDRGEKMELHVFGDLSSSGDKAFIERLSSQVSGGNYVYLFDTRTEQWSVGAVHGFLKSEKDDFPEVEPGVFYPLKKWFEEV